jgi:hypothetical protein
MNHPTPLPPSRNSSTRRRTKRDLHNPVGELKEFISVCAQARKQLDPENIKANVGRKVSEFFNGLDEDSQGLLRDIAGMIRRPR